MHDNINLSRRHLTWDRTCPAILGTVADTSALWVISTPRSGAEGLDGGCARDKQQHKSDIKNDLRAVGAKT